MPSGSAGEASTDQLEPEAGVGSVAIGEPLVSVPAYTLTVTVARSPGAAPAPPLNVGLASPVTAPSAGLVSVTDGTVVSTVHVRVAGEASVLAAGSVARTSNV